MELAGTAQMQEESARFVGALAPRASTATVIALSGDLGAGKTTFAQGIARTLGVAEAVTSPTFVIEKIYALQGQQWQRFVHIDAYRLTSPHELEVLGWGEIVQDPENLIVIEWPEKIAALMPAHALRVSLAGSSETRTITYHT